MFFQFQGCKGAIDKCNDSNLHLGMISFAGLTMCIGYWLRPRGHSHISLLVFRTIGTALSWFKQWVGLVAQSPPAYGMGNAGMVR